MMNLIWFTDEKCLSYQHLATWKHEIRHHAIQTTQWCVLVNCLAGSCKSRAIGLFLQLCESERFGRFLRLQW